MAFWRRQDVIAPFWHRLVPGCAHMGIWQEGHAEPEGGVREMRSCGPGTWQRARATRETKSSAVCPACLCSGGWEGEK